jgi:hypothetical protein
MRSRALATAVLTIALLAPPSLAAPGDSSLKSYEHNSASGDYAAPVTPQGGPGSRGEARAEAEEALQRRSEALNRALAQERYYSSYGTSVASPSHSGFAWGDAAVGAGVAVALIGALGAVALLRRRIRTAGSRRAAVYGS